MKIPKDGAQTILASDLTEVTWQQVMLSFFADAAVAVSYVGLLFIMVYLNRAKTYSIFLPRRAYFLAFAIVLVINGAASFASLVMTGVAITMAYKLLVATMIAFTVAAVWRVLPKPSKTQTEASARCSSPKSRHAAAEEKLREMRDTIGDKVREEHLERLNQALETEVAERQQAEEHAVAARQRAEDLILRTATATAVLSAEGVVMEANAALAQLLGRATKEELMDRPLAQLLGLKGEETLRHFVDETLRQGTGASTFAADPPSRGSIQIEATGSASTRGDSPSVIALFRDATDKASAEQGLLQSREALAEALDAARRVNATTSDFLAKMNHELRTPLNGIIGLAEVLRHRAMEDRLAVADVLRMTENIQQGGTLLLSLVDDLLDLSRLEAGRRTLSPIVLDVREEINAAITSFASVSDEKRVRILNQCDDKLEWSVDERAFKQIVINLVSNAVKFSPVGSRVYVRVTHGTEMMRLSVIDEGPGISQNDRKRILLPFGRGDAAASQRAEGVGLGLTIVSELLKLQGGKLEIGNSETGGAVFTAVFPVGATVRLEPTPEQPAS